MTLTARVRWQSSYFVDLPDQLTTNLQPYFVDVCRYMDDARKVCVCV